MATFPRRFAGMRAHWRCRMMMWFRCCLPMHCSRGDMRTRPRQFSSAWPVSRRIFPKRRKQRRIFSAGNKVGVRGGWKVQVDGGARRPDLSVPQGADAAGGRAFAGEDVDAERMAKFVNRAPRKCHTDRIRGVE